MTRAPSKRWWVGIVAIGALGLAPATLRAQDSLEYPVKAAFLSKFASYVQWPTGDRAPGAPINLCVVGEGGFGDMVQSAVDGQRGSGLALVVSRHLRAPRQGCDVLFAGGSGQESVQESLRAVAGRPVLTVTDERRGAGRGMLHFTVHQGRVRFHIDARAARGSGLSISSKLLSLALSVRAGWAPPEQRSVDHG